MGNTTPTTFATMDSPEVIMSGISAGRANESITIINGTVNTTIAKSIYYVRKTFMVNNATDQQVTLQFTALPDAVAAASQVPFNVQAGQVVAATTKSIFTINDHYPYLYVQVTATAAAGNGKTCDFYLRMLSR